MKINVDTRFDAFFVYIE